MYVHALFTRSTSKILIFPSKEWKLPTFALKEFSASAKLFESKWGVFTLLQEISVFCMPGSLFKCWSPWGDCQAEGLKVSPRASAFEQRAAKSPGPRTDTERSSVHQSWVLGLLLQGIWRLTWGNLRSVFKSRLRVIEGKAQPERDRQAEGLEVSFRGLYLQSRSGKRPQKLCTAPRKLRFRCCSSF